jgi:hypothetical protein
LVVDNEKLGAALSNLREAVPSLNGRYQVVMKFDFRYRVIFFAFAFFFRSIKHHTDAEGEHLYSLKPHNLQSLISAGAGALGAKSFGDEQKEIESNPLFHKFLAAVTAKGFFKGTVEGDQEHKARYQKMVLRFKDKLAQAAKATDSTGVSENGPGVVQQPEVQQAEVQAEILKEEGNELLKQKDYAGATEAYTKAIQVRFLHKPHFSTLVFCSLSLSLSTLHSFFSFL